MKGLPATSLEDRIFSTRKRQWQSGMASRPSNAEEREGVQGPVVRREGQDELLGTRYQNREAWGARREVRDEHVGSV